MFIYLLCEDGYSNAGVENAVELATIDIQKILDYLSLDNMHYLRMTDYSIIVKIDGEEYSEELCVSKRMIEKLIKYPPSRLMQYKSEYDDMKNKITKWCEDISVQLEEERKQKEESDRFKKEQDERVMYERLKAKYDDERNIQIDDKPICGRKLEQDGINECNNNIKDIIQNKIEEYSCFGNIAKVEAYLDCLCIINANE